VDDEVEYSRGRWEEVGEGDGRRMEEGEMPAWQPPVVPTIHRTVRNFKTISRKYVPYDS
jgi:hypothetical protein